MCCVLSVAYYVYMAHGYEIYILWQIHNYYVDGRQNPQQLYRYKTMYNND